MVERVVSNMLLDPNGPHHAQDFVVFAYQLQVAGGAGRNDKLDGGSSLGVGNRDVHAYLGNRERVGLTISYQIEARYLARLYLQNARSEQIVAQVYCYCCCCGRSRSHPGRCRRGSGQWG